MQLFKWKRIATVVEEAVTMGITDVVVEKQRVEQEESERLRIIQDHFIIESHGRQIDPFLYEQLQREQQVP